MPNQKFKLLLLDLDGTTVASGDGTLPSKAVISAVKAAQKHVHVALATGRPLQLSQSVVDMLGLEGPSVFNGGAEIIDVTSHKELYRQDLDIETLRELVKLALPFGYNIYNDKDQYEVALTSPDKIQGETAKLFIDAVKINDIPPLLETLSAVKGAAAYPTTSWSSGDVMDIHITHEHATKRHGVDILLHILDVSKEQVIAIGDGHNDIPLLEAAGFKVAMGNAPDEVKAIADFVAPSLDDDGVAEAIKKFIL